MVDTPKFHEIKTVHKPFPLCKEVKCLCGDTYKEHKIDYFPCCDNCGEPLAFDKFTVIVSECGVASIDTKHSLGYCPKCNGVDLFGYSKSDISDIINLLNHGNTVIYRKTK